VVTALEGHPDRRFIWAEISFFHRWWNDQSDRRREVVRRLVSSGQLEFVSGGWVQNDEANPSFVSVIEQITWGHEYLFRNFGKRPHFAWNVDPFGHSSVTPLLFKQMGFEAVVINRIRYDLKDSFKRGQTMEFLWETPMGDLFAHVLHTHYSAPQGFDWEDGMPQVTPGNVGDRARQLQGILSDRANAYRTCNLLVPFGDDFKFKRASYQFENMDQLISEINSKPQVYQNLHLRYATLSDYFKAVSAEGKDTNITFPVFKGDFFPYADNAQSYWTGFYTTRPVLKVESRLAESILHTGSVFTALAQAITSIPPLHTHAIREGWRQVSLSQHHDGITGTCRAPVADDYISRLRNAQEAGWKALVEGALALLGGVTHAPSAGGTVTAPPNAGPEVASASTSAPESAAALLVKRESSTWSSGPLGEGERIIVANGLGRSRKKLISIGIDRADVQVTQLLHKENVNAQVVPSQLLASEGGNFQLTWIAHCPGMGLCTFVIEPLQPNGKASEQVEEEAAAAQGSRFFTWQPSGPMVRGAQAPDESELRLGPFSLSPSTGLPVAWQSPATGQWERISVTPVTVASHQSGAYMFTPGGGVEVSSLPVESIALWRGGTRGVVEQCTVTWAKGMLKIIWRWIPDLEVLEAEIHVKAESAKEIGLKWESDIAHGGTIFVDNGVEVIERKRDFSRAMNENTYPAVYAGFLEGTSSSGRQMRLTISKSVSSGMLCSSEGELLTFLHRNLPLDDGRGLSEPNNDFSEASVVHRIRFTELNAVNTAEKEDLLRMENNDAINRAMLAFNIGQMKTRRPGMSVLSEDIPLPLQLVSFRPHMDFSPEVALRIAHLPTRAIVDYEQLPKPQKLSSISQLFNNHLQFSYLRDVTLSLSDTSRLPLLSFARAGRIDPTTFLLNPHATLARQNTDEEGVFLSHAALEKAGKWIQKETSGRVGGGRRLMKVSMDDQNKLSILPTQFISFLIQYAHQLQDGEQRGVIPPLASVDRPSSSVFAPPIASSTTTTTTTIPVSGGVDSYESPPMSSSSSMTKTGRGYSYSFVSWMTSSHIFLFVAVTVMQCVVVGVVAYYLVRKVCC
jgi:lysosomal alpha-mannosidase